MFRFFLLIVFMGIGVLTFAQQKPVPPQQIREANVLFSKRVWRVIDLREKQNKIADWPRNPLTSILYQAALEGKLRAYVDDSLKTFMDLEQFGKKGAETIIIKKLLDPEGDDDGPYKMDTVTEPFKPTERVKQLLIMEEWYFDSKESSQRVQIIAIAPLYERMVTGVEMGTTPLCWFKFYDRFDKEIDCRDILVNQQMYNGGNTYNKFTYDDWFLQRKFNSFIIKESNPYDIFIADDPDVKRNGLDALIRAARVRENMQQLEEDYYER